MPKKAELKTKKNNASVSSFLNSIENEERKKDAKTVLALMKKVTKEKPKMWGGSIIGFGDWTYKYKSGREGDWFRVGFSPRKAALSIYLMVGYQDFTELLKKLGPHKIGKGCLYIKRLSDIDIKILEKMIKQACKDIDKLNV